MATILLGLSAGRNLGSTVIDAIRPVTAALMLPRSHERDTLDAGAAHRSAFHTAGHLCWLRCSRLAFTQDAFISNLRSALA